MKLIDFINTCNDEWFYFSVYHLKDDDDEDGELIGRVIRYFSRDAWCTTEIPENIQNKEVCSWYGDVGGEEIIVYVKP